MNPSLGLIILQMVKHIQLLRSKSWITTQMSIHTNEDYFDIVFQNLCIDIQFNSPKNPHSSFN